MYNENRSDLVNIHMIKTSSQRTMQRTVPVVVAVGDDGSVLLVFVGVEMNLTDDIEVGMLGCIITSVVLVFVVVVIVVGAGLV